MEREIVEIYCETHHDIPTIERINELPRFQKMKVLFGHEIEPDRESIGNKWKSELKDFLIGIHMQLPEINISRLISAEEIVDHYDFFERCAKDYGKLAKKLITQLARYLQVEVIPKDPYANIYNLRLSKHTPENRLMDTWKYFLHGHHCRFKNIHTEQQIEVALLFGQDYGVLDPFSFTKYIMSTPDYNPLPVEIYEDFHDGVRILDIMEKIGKFEKVERILGGSYSPIVKDRKY